MRAFRGTGKCIIGDRKFRNVLRILFRVERNVDNRILIGSTDATRFPPNTFLESLL